VRLRLLGWMGMIGFGFGWASGCQVGFAQEEEAAQEDAAPAEEAPAETPAPEVTATSSDAPAATEEPGEVPAPVRMHQDRQTMGTDRWENALDAKFTSLFERKASNVSSPTVMLTAIWNRKFRYNTYVGLTASGLPQSHAEKKDGVKTSYTMYYGGLNLAQGLYEWKPFRAIVEVQGGVGQSYVRVKADGVDSKAHVTKFNYVEPGLVVMVYEWKHLEMGLVATNRMVRVEKKEDEFVENDDLSGVSYGLTFRTQRW
jgi:hypothetical protein